jgi:hypothetical protein
MNIVLNRSITLTGYDFQSLDGLFPFINIIVVALCLKGHLHIYSGIPFVVTDDIQLTGITESLCSSLK